MADEDEEELKNEEDELGDVKKNEDTGEEEDIDDEDANKMLSTKDAMQDAPGSDVDRMANLLGELEKEVVKLEALVSDWESAEDDEEEQDKITEEIPKVVSQVKKGLRNLDDTRLRLRSTLPSADEYETELLSRAKSMLQRAEEILKD
ncbi:Uncharacterised protein [uncultured archaeon]|nr:Uncharacterised protein [uncultured archaeon]